MDLSVTAIVQAAADNELILKDLLPAIWNVEPSSCIDVSSLVWQEYLKGLMAANEVNRLHLDSTKNLNLIQFVKDNVRLTKPELVEGLSSGLPGIKPALGAIDPAVQIWLLISIDDWDDMQTLEQFIHSYFREMRSIPTSIPSISKDFQHLQPREDQRHLSLTIEDDAKHLRIFHLSSSLEMQGISRDWHDQN